MDVQKIFPVINKLLDPEYWQLKTKTADELVFLARKPLPGSFPEVRVEARPTGFELIADGDVWQDLRADLQKLYGRASWAIDMNVFIGHATFRCR